MESRLDADQLAMHKCRLGVEPNTTPKQTQFVVRVPDFKPSTLNTWPHCLIKEAGVVNLVSLTEMCGSSLLVHTPACS